MDVVWLKRDARLIDHGPLSEISRSIQFGSNRRWCILYLYEPDQLSEPTVHGSHVNFINEGLANLDNKLSGADGKTDATTKATKAAMGKKVSSDENDNNKGGIIQNITLCYGECTETLTAMHSQHKINRILAHEETGHMASYVRDRRVRRWCRKNNVPFIEFVQSGVTRCLKDRDDFSAKLHEFLDRPQYDTPDLERIKPFLVTDINIPQRQMTLLHPSDINEIPCEHRGDRMNRQKGGEDEAILTFKSFLYKRGVGYSGGISSPNTSWTTCSRISTYLSWGNISIRYVIQSVQRRQGELKALKKSRPEVKIDGNWGKSLGAFLSRMHWRSHFIQKLESEPIIEKRDACSAYQPLRRQENDWNEEYYQAWSTGQTGYPFVDACMRCLHSTGWINFRMRTMLVSFACWNLWLDWKKIAPHLGRLFLDFEPGIHYPQLQMQAGTTGINAMRVYNVTKQGKDQDPNGVFTRKYVPELGSVPKEFIHEPWKLTKLQQVKYNVSIIPLLLPSSSSSGDDALLSSSTVTDQKKNKIIYPPPIVDEKTSAKEAKDKVASIKKLESTRQLAHQVYQKHGSRNKRMVADDAAVFRPTASPSSKSVASNKRVKVDASNAGQQSIRNMFDKLQQCKATKTKPHAVPTSPNKDNDINNKEIITNDQNVLAISNCTSTKDSSIVVRKITHQEEEEEEEEEVVKNSSSSTTDMKKETKSVVWNCQVCTFLNEKPHAPICAMCGSKRERV